MAKQGFHHGDLRSALLALAGKELEKFGLEALSLRHLAGRAGVSRAAPYRHFASKDDLLKVLAQRGIDELDELYHRAAALEGSPRERLALAFRFHLEFAESKPEHFQLIFVRTGAFRSTVEGVRTSTWDYLESLIAALLPEEIRHGDGQARRMVAIACWSTIHGFAMLRLAGRFRRVAVPPDAVDRIIETAVAIAELPRAEISRPRAKGRGESRTARK
jgi:AcrR family transcriptional regulator